MKSFCGTEEILPFIRDRNITLNTLVLKVSSRNTEAVFNQLRELCDQNAIQSLYLVDDMRSLRGDLPKLNNLIGCAEMTTADVLKTFSHVKMIKMNIVTLSQAKQLASRLVNLEEAYFDVLWFDMILPFIRYAPKLSKIFISNTNRMKHQLKFSLFKLNKLRQKLPYAKNVTLYLNETAYLKVKGMSIGSKCNAVQIKPIEAHITNNPFVRTILDN